MYSTDSHLPWVPSLVTCDLPSLIAAPDQLIAITVGPMSKSTSTSTPSRLDVEFAGIAGTIDTGDGSNAQPITDSSSPTATSSALEPSMGDHSSPVPASSGSAPAAAAPAGLSGPALPPLDFLQSPANQRPLDLKALTKAMTAALLAPTSFPVVHPSSGPPVAPAPAASVSAPLPASARTAGSTLAAAQQGARAQPTPPRDIASAVSAITTLAFTRLVDAIDGSGPADDADPDDADASHPAPVIIKGGKSMARAGLRLLDLHGSNVRAALMSLVVDHVIQSFDLYRKDRTVSWYFALSRELGVAGTPRPTLHA